MTNSIVIHNTEISQDDVGRFCINDLHRAAGGEKRHQPSNWFQLSNTQELVSEIEKEIPGIPGILTKQGLGTFVVKELVYAYAMWVSPKFHLEVIRTFDAVRSGQMTPKLPVEIGEATVLGMLRVAEICGVPKSYAIQISAAEATRQSGMPWDLLLTQAAAMNNVPQEDVMLEPTELGKLFEVSAIAMNKLLAEMGLQVREGGEWVPTEEGLPLSSKHAWVRGPKSGYNLKWKAVEIERRMA